MKQVNEIIRIPWDFKKNFNAEIIIESPGRINLIGEHTDYNNGYALPVAINKSITLKFKKNESDSLCTIRTTGYNLSLHVDLNNLRKSSTDWSNYVIGVLSEISIGTDKLRGFDCVIESDLPIGSGLSSSAALECGLSFGLNELFQIGLSKMEIIKLSQRAEHKFVGTQCGIMDQYASVMGEPEFAMLLDCKSNSHIPIPLRLGSNVILMLNTRVSHNLATSEYNVRRSECEEGVDILKDKYPSINSLRDATHLMVDSCKEKMKQTIYNRCCFIVAENMRVLQMAEALESYDIEAAARLLYQSHEGLSKLYEVSCKESDFLVEFSKHHGAVLGARQTGGGFGGCVLTILPESKVEPFVVAITKAYKETFGIKLETFTVASSRGTTIKFKA